MICIEYNHSVGYWSEDGYNRIQKLWLIFLISIVLGIHKTSHIYRNIKSFSKPIVGIDDHEQCMRFTNKLIVNMSKFLHLKYS